MTHLKFVYINWHGDLHTYIIELDSLKHKPSDINLPFLSLITYGRCGCFPDEPDKEAWTISGRVITRDGDPRPEMDGRRRTFALMKMRHIEEVPA